ncbi:iron hydrogenase small subunit [uncultured Clostridium sp.]|uniref:iron hydrogenase small subunit n=1 Tax=uncultured Clostridium sp. TaxID=59620 RepID=UPI0025F5C0A4|nr:iron hydrogenase small subunit [uncultured Clostridium sp.]MDU4883085.1 iron hydrogenase small subunit [Clostridium celatum]MDU4979292.1 iron hydrogenase small subunit [Clostridium celatum]
MYLKLAVVQGTAHSRTLIEKIKNNEVKYDFIEVMACKGGCIGGGGQPKTTRVINDKIRLSRIEGLYGKDVELKIKCSYQNPDIIAVYDEFYKEPLSHLAHELLHTAYSSKKHMLGLDNEEEIFSEEIV